MLYSSYVNKWRRKLGIDDIAEKFKNHLAERPKMPIIVFTLLKPSDVPVSECE